MHNFIECAIAITQHKGILINLVLAAIVLLSAIVIRITKEAKKAKEKPQCLKTTLLRKWRRNAFERIGVFEKRNKKYMIVFDKTAVACLNHFSEAMLDTKFYQVLEDDIETIEDAMSACDFYRRVFILREARKEWQERIFGNSMRKY